MGRGARHEGLWSSVISVPSSRQPFRQSKEGVRAADALTLSEDASVLAARPTKDQSPGPGAAALDHGDRKRPIIETGDTPPTKLVKTEAIQTPSIPQWVRWWPDGSVYVGGGGGSREEW